jgi:hypothetical protein
LQRWKPKSSSSQQLPRPLLSSGRTSAPFRPAELLELLVGHGLEFVLIGGVAERLLGSPRVTGDIDICPSSKPANLQRLAVALNDVEAAFRPPGVEENVPPPEPWDARSFWSFTGLALTTRLGWLDVWFTPDGTKGYPDLIENATEMELRGVRFRVASLDDIIRNKEAAGGLKYLAHLPLLRELRERRRSAGS